MRDITYKDIAMKNILGDAIQMTLNYHPGIPATNATATPTFKNLLIENVHATGVGAAGLFDGLPESHVMNMTLRNVTIERFKTEWQKCDFVDGKCEGGTAPCPVCFDKPPTPPTPPPPPAKVCTLATVQGCFNVSASDVLPFETSAVHDHTTQGNCALACSVQQNGALTIAGIDQGNHCRCGVPSNVAAAKAAGKLLPAAACDSSEWPCSGVCCGPHAPRGSSCTLGKCTGNPDEWCGGVRALMAYTYSCA